ncbi:sigma-54 interaction domain-containing protein [Frisingicoccus sp.]|uniref:sigma-54 interaction domain-containing protein n=1 Tax=Frisingicoccus sp. TaxID=1918627 RepID=UPI00399A9D85
MPDKKMEIIAESPQMKKILQTIEYIKDVDSSVLITGESGTGKEVIFKYICQTSRRCEQPVVKINCGAIPENLFESELFGYEDGAFTGARKKGKAGLFEMANHGTLFLDEIGEMSLEMQVKLLRAIQEKEIFRVGGSKNIPVDVRIIAATNQNIDKMVEEGRFRRDLFYRLNVIRLEIPPLRERHEDIIPLCYHFLEIFNKKYNKNKGLTLRAARTLAHLEWPGNIRELENLVENIVVLEQDEVMRAKHLQERYCKGEMPLGEVTVKGILPYKEALSQMERQLLENTRNQFGSTRRMAEALGLNQSTISRKLRQYHLDDAAEHHS